MASGLIALEAAVGGTEWLRGARRARRLATLSLAWLCFEGAATTTAGLLAGSIALVGNGLDGAIEGLASVIVVWRFTGSRTLSISAERRAQQLVALSFFLLAPYIAFEATGALLTEHHAETTLLGIGLSIGTLCVCPWLGRAKLRLGQQLGSPATAGEGRQNLICGYLALAVLAGLSPTPYSASGGSIRSSRSRFPSWRSSKDVGPGGANRAVAQAARSDEPHSPPARPPRRSTATGSKSNGTHGRST